jgi:hypothetical protein
MADRVLPKRTGPIDLPAGCKKAFRMAGSLARLLLREVLGHPDQTQSLSALYLPSRALPIAAHASVTARRLRRFPEPKGVAIPRLGISNHPCLSHD